MQFAWVAQAPGIMDPVKIAQDTIREIQSLLVDMPSSEQRRAWLAELGTLRFALLAALEEGRRPIAFLEITAALVQLRERIEEHLVFDVARDARGFATFDNAVA